MAEKPIASFKTKTGYLTDGDFENDVKPDPETMAKRTSQKGQDDLDRIIDANVKAASELQKEKA